MFTTDVELGRDTLAVVSELGDVVERLAETIVGGGLSAVALTDLPEVVTTLLRLADQVDAAATSATGRLHRAGTLPIATTRWLQNSAGLSATSASATLGLACSLQETYTSTASEWVSGRISRSHARAIAVGIDAVARPVAAERKAELRDAAERALLRYAADGATPADVSRKATRIRVIVDPEGMAADALEIDRAQFLRFTPDVDGVKVSGFLSAETHAVVATALQQIVDTQHRTGSLPAEQRHDGDGPASEHMRRVRAPHLRALALHHLAGTFLETGVLGTHHGVIPRALVTAHLHDLHARFGALVTAPGHDDATQVGPDSARRILCDAEVTAAIVSGARPRRASTPEDCVSEERWLDDLLLASAREVLYVGRAKRIVTTALRRALELRDRHCTGPGCRVDVSRCRAHHVRHWEDGGGTDLDNLALVCERCHHLVHEGSWSMTRSPDRRAHEHGCWTWSPPPPRRP